MKIEEFIDYIEMKHRMMFTKGDIIDYLSDKKDDWVLIIKAFLIKDNHKWIRTTYLLGKLGFMVRNPNQQEIFLDYQGLEIYRALKKGVPTNYKGLIKK